MNWVMVYVRYILMYTIVLEESYLQTDHPFIAPFRRHVHLVSPMSCPSNNDQIPDGDCTFHTPDILSCHRGSRASIKEPT